MKAYWFLGTQNEQERIEAPTFLEAWHKAGELMTIADWEVEEGEQFDVRDN